MENLLQYNPDELKSVFLSSGEPAYRSIQLFNWVYKKFVFDFSEMSDMPKARRPFLSDNFQILNLKLIEYQISAEEDTVKFLFQTLDNKYIESVLILAGDDPGSSAQNLPDTRFTLCVSSQTGCPLGCKFCATGLLGAGRNLEIGEIISQVLLAEKYIFEHLYTDRNINHSQISRNISNIVFMGMGEPLLNYENVLKSIAILNSANGYNLGSRHFTLSTAGLIPEILRLKDEKTQIRLALSLHASVQSKREQLMPIAKKNSLEALIPALRSYQNTADRRITIEYIMLKGINMNPEDAAELKKLLSGLDYHINLIAYNPAEALPFQSPSAAEIQAFIENLKKLGISYVLRASKGSGIQAGCGQLGLTWKN